jgi:hypothetical protein
LATYYSIEKGGIKMHDWIKRLPGYEEYEKADKEVLARMDQLAKMAEQKIQEANLAQKVHDAVKEHRFVYYADKNGSRIYH